MSALPSETSSHRLAQGLAGFATLLALLVGMACWLLYGRMQELDQAVAVAQRRAESLDAEQARLTRLNTDLIRRFEDDAALNRSLREEVLGVGERAALLEEALRRISENRLDSVQALRLNQAEWLLSAGIERLQVFQDPESALAALQLADAELARLDDAGFAGVRQSLASEIAALQSIPMQAYADQLVALADLRARLPDLPPKMGATTPAEEIPAKAGRFERLLRSMVRVRRIDPQSADLVGPLALDTLRAVILLDLQHAEEALRRRDSVRFQRLLEQARRMLEVGFELDDPAASTTREQLEQLAAYEAPAWPELGEALTQLVNLRHTRDLARGVER